MKAKDVLIDFINIIFFLFLVGFILIYIIVGDRFGPMISLMESLIPVSFYGLIFVVMIKIKRMNLKERRKKGESDEDEIVLYLTYFDRFLSDIIIYLLPIVILLIAFLSHNYVSLTDVFQATIAFAIMLTWQKILFRRGKSQ